MKSNAQESKKQRRASRLSKSNFEAQTLHFAQFVVHFMAYNPFAPTSVASPPGPVCCGILIRFFSRNLAWVGLAGPPDRVPGVPAVPFSMPVTSAAAPAPSGPAKVSIAQAAMQSAMNKRQGRVTLQSTSVKRPPTTEPTKPPTLTGTTTESAGISAISAPNLTETGQKRRRWDSTEPVVAGSGSSSLSTVTAGVPGFLASDSATKLATSSQSKDYEEQLRQQKEIQFLEARIRGMKVLLRRLHCVPSCTGFHRILFQGDSSKLQSLESLHNERLKHYEVLFIVAGRMLWL